MPIPQNVVRTRLFQRLAGSRFLHIIEGLRDKAEALGRQIEMLLPEYTDHSVRHMDALWNVADAVLLLSEVNDRPLEELFLLGCAFYLHDLGMAAACTPEGLERLKATGEYRHALANASGVDGVTKNRAEVLAARSAARCLHANLALELAVDPIPGLGQYLIDSDDYRDKWGRLIGEVAASHAWSLQQVEERLGRRGLVPTADSGSVDLAFVACALRICDCAHINRDRALRFDRELRPEVSQESSLHWDAQANVTGPIRDGSQLVYGCTAPIASVDAWWLFYDLATGLDIEIRTARDYLDGRKASAGRFSLTGVRGTESPEAFSQYVHLDSAVAPIDVRVQPHSMEKVIELLGGRALYRDDRLAPVRELIQNCRDAITLRNAMEVAERGEPTPGRVDAVLDLGAPARLIIRDNGIGMTRAVVKNHLIVVASNFWRSVECERDFGRALAAGFQPIGRFGIGFLSVFMLGHEVEVETERPGERRVLLRLHGLGRRGELCEQAGTGRIGTEVRIRLSPTAAESLRQLPAVIKARAPMLPFALRVVTILENGSREELTVEPKWWANATASAIEAFVSDWREVAKIGRILSPQERRQSTRHNFAPKREGFEVRGWPGPRPEWVEEAGRLIDSGEQGPSGVLVCSHGIAIGVRDTVGLLGLVEVGELDVAPERNSPSSDERVLAVLGGLRAGLSPSVRRELGKLEQFGLIPARMRFIRAVAARYGVEMLTSTPLRWIPTLEQPGNMVHKSCTELRDLVAIQQSLVVSCSTPAVAYDLSARRLGEAQLGRGVSVLLPFLEFEPSYETVKRIEVENGSSKLRGTLPEILNTIRDSGDGVILLDAVLQVIAGAWSTTKDELKTQQWEVDVDHFRGWLWVNLSRPS